MIRTLYAGAGGLIGSVFRYLLGGAVSHLFAEPAFPVGTLVINVLGCLLIGILGGLAEVKGVLSAEMRVFLMVGILGGFTTFSTFGFETLQLMRDGQFAYATGNVLGSVLLGLAAVWAGFSVARLI